MKNATRYTDQVVLLVLVLLTVKLDESNQMNESMKPGD